MEGLDQLASYMAELNLPTWAIASGISFASLMVFLGLKTLLLARLAKVTDKTKWFFDSLFMRALGLPLTIVIIGFHLVVLERLFEHFDLSGKNFDLIASVIAKILLVFAIIVFFDRLSVGTLDHYTRRSPILYNSQGLARGLVRGLIFGLGLLVLLGTLGISVTPIIASLGITSLAVALALQPTLENFFSGVQLLVDKPFKVGDFIQLESGEMGYVQKIGWRSTWVKMLQNNTVVLPNSRISESKVLNYDYPAKELSVLVEVGVHYDSDLEHVEQVTLEVARAILKDTGGGQSEFEPMVMYHTFGDSSINFTVVLRALEYADSFVLKSEFVKKLHRRYGEEGITIPYPIRALNLSQEQVDFDTLLQSRNPSEAAAESESGAESKPGPEPKPEALSDRQKQAMVYASQQQDVTTENGDSGGESNGDGSGSNGR